MKNQGDYLLLRGNAVPVRLEDVPHDKLMFWPENPRIYTLLDHSEEGPSQSEIFNKMRKLEHVKELRHDISENGGLIDPIIVRDDDFVVFEGNSRLAAFRLLASHDPLKWKNVRCRIIPNDTSKEAVFVLLGQYHLKGKKDWMPFEKAAFIYRRLKEHKVSVADLAGELGITPQEVKKFRDVYEMMKKHNEDKRDRWNHYLQMLSNRTIQKAMDDTPGLEEKTVSMIQAGELSATDVRDKMKTICKSPRIVKKFMNGSKNFEEAYEDAKYVGGESVELARVEKFQRWICDSETREEILSQNKSVRDKMKLSLKRTVKGLSIIQKQLDGQDQGEAS